MPSDDGSLGRMDIRSGGTVQGHDRLHEVAGGPDGTARAGDLQTVQGVAVLPGGGYVKRVPFLGGSRVSVSILENRKMTENEKQWDALVLFVKAGVAVFAVWALGVVMLWW